MPNIRKTPTKIIGFRVRDDMLEFFNSLENKNDFLVGLVSRQFNKKMPPLPKNHCLKQ